MESSSSIEEFTKSMTIPETGVSLIVSVKEEGGGGRTSGVHVGGSGIE
jgi:hypothetical protein